MDAPGFDRTPGETRSVLTGIPGKTGIIYTLDRETEEISVRPTVAQTVVCDIDPVTGAVRVNPEMLFTAPGKERLVGPTVNGGKLWPTEAYSPLTGAMYLPLQNTCMNTTSLDPEPEFSFLEDGGRQSSRS